MSSLSIRLGRCRGIPALTLLAAAPGALLGGWLGEHVGLRAALAFAGGVSVLLVLVAWRLPLIRQLKSLPEPERESDWIGAEAATGFLPEREDRNER